MKESDQGRRQRVIDPTSRKSELFGISINSDVEAIHRTS